MMRKRLLPVSVLDHDAPTGQPTDVELMTLSALAALVLPSTAGESGRALVRSRILEQSLQTPGMLVEYQRAVRLLDATGPQAGVPFHARPVEAQLAALRALFPTYAATDRVRRVRVELFASRDARAARAFVVSDLLGAFYQTAEGWATVGYSHFPGVAAADPLAYTRAPDRMPERQM